MEILTFQNKKVIVTGANDEQFVKFRLGTAPYPVFTLKHDPEKTDSAYYTQMLEHYSLKPDEVIYFEHNPEAVKSAQSIGIKTYFYDHNKKDLDALKTFLVENL